EGAAPAAPSPTAVLAWGCACWDDLLEWQGHPPGRTHQAPGRCRAGEGAAWRQDLTGRFRGSRRARPPSGWEGSHEVVRGPDAAGAPRAKDIRAGIGLGPIFQGDNLQSSGIGWPAPR